MALSTQLLEILVDPLSKQPVELVEGKDGRKRLHCKSNGLFYRIDEPGIPVMLIDEAELEDGSSAKELVARLRAESVTKATSGPAGSTSAESRIS